MRSVLYCVFSISLFENLLYSFHFMSFQRNLWCKHESFENISASHDNRILIISYQNAKIHHCQHLPSSQPHSEWSLFWSKKYFKLNIYILGCYSINCYFCTSRNNSDPSCEVTGNSSKRALILTIALCSNFVSLRTPWPRSTSATPRTVRCPRRDTWDSSRPTSVSRWLGPLVSQDNNNEIWDRHLPF